MRIVVVIFSRKQVVSQPTTSSSQQTTRKDAKKRKHEEQDIDLQMLNDAFQVLRSSNKLANDPYNSYGQHLANELRKYDPTVT